MATAAIVEDHIDQATLEWLAGLSWSTLQGLDTSLLTPTPGTARASYREAVLAVRLRDGIARLNPHIPSRRDLPRESRPTDYLRTASRLRES